MHVKLQADPKRAYHRDTGIYVRAELDGKFDNFDIADLTAESLLKWLRSRGGDNSWAENTVGMLLGHKHPLRP